MKGRLMGLGRWFLGFGLLGVLWLGCGCVTGSGSRGYVLTGDAVVDGWMMVTNGPPADRVLWQYRTALAHLRRGEGEAAAGLLDGALAAVEGRFGSDGGARRARGYFSKESVKGFIGEPYERVMAYFYRGLLYWADGELDNARACFLSGQVEDGDAEEGYRGDYVLLDYLEGLVLHRLGGDGSDGFGRAVEGARFNVPGPLEGVGNVLFFVEYGRGPLKVAEGEYKERLRLVDGGSRVSGVRLRVRGVDGSLVEEVELGAVDDLGFQATTRGGRVMDYVLGRKAVFKKTTDRVGDVALVSGLALAQNKSTEELGLGLAVAGLLGKVVSAATRPRADTRAWDGLPKFLGFGSVVLGPGEYVVGVEFLNEGLAVVEGLGGEFSLGVGVGDGDVVVLVSEAGGGGWRL